MHSIIFCPMCLYSIKITSGPGGRAECLPYWLIRGQNIHEWQRFVIDFMLILWVGQTSMNYDRC